MTYCIRSKQRFAAYKVEGKREELVAGDPDEVIDVEDYWVFERKTRKAVDDVKTPVEGARWRLVKRQTRA
jgi:large subunit ribosomal protein L45